MRQLPHCYGNPKSYLLNLNVGKRPVKPPVLVWLDTYRSPTPNRFVSARP